MSGVPTNSLVAITFAGQSVSWSPQPHRDRQFFVASLPGEVAPGRHSLSFAATSAAAGGGAGSVGDDGSGSPRTVLCHLMVHAVDASDETAAAAAAAGGVAVARAAGAQDALVGAYPIFTGGGELIGYRPTQQGCLMRDMSQRRLCPVCREGLWENLLLSANARAAGISLLHQARQRGHSRTARRT